MPQAIYESFREMSPLGITYSWNTESGGLHPLHWHNEMEILFPLNGKAEIMIEGEKHPLLKRHILVVESGQVHSTYTFGDIGMFLCIHVQKEKLNDYLKNFDMMEIRCMPDEIPQEQFAVYLSICQKLDELTRLYILGTKAFGLEAQGVILQVVAELAEHFSNGLKREMSAVDQLSRDRIRTVIQYVEEHYREQISLADISGQVGLGCESFCRFFKKNMGISFLQYLNETRLAHVYYDLTHTDHTIAEIMEDHGLTNQKLFNESFKEVYGCTPREVRKEGT